MKRALILTLLLCVIVAGGMCATVLEVNGAKDQVEFELYDQYGEEAAAQGLTITLEANYDDRLHWHTTYRPGTQSAVHTDFRMTYGQERDRQGYVLREREYEFSVYSSVLPENNLALQKLMESAPYGETVRKTVRMKDYYQYYPLTAMLEAPGTFLHWESGHTEEELLEMGYLQPDIDAIRSFNRFFRIPVLEEEKMIVDLTRYDSGSYSVGVDTNAGTDWFDLNMVGTVTQNGIFMTFDNRSMNGKIVDTSQIPGGYGIYRLPYKDEYDSAVESGLLTDQLAMVYPLDEQVRVIDIDTDESGEKLLLHTIEADTYIFTVIDSATSKTLQRIEVDRWPQEENGFYVWEGEGYLAIWFRHERIAVLSLDSGGRYSLDFVTDLWGEEIEPDYYPNEAVMDYDGWRLAMVGRVDAYRRYRYDNCSFYLAVLDPTGLIYYGKYFSSLDTGLAPSLLNYACSLEYSHPMQATWEKN